MKNSILLRGAMAFERHPTSFILETIPTIRSWFDGELVVCTWKGQEKYLEGVRDQIDRLVLLDDPGTGFIQEYNRQLVSYQKGLEECSGNIIFVARTDFNILENPFHLWEKVPTANNNIMKVFDKRVVVGNMMTIHPQKVKPSEGFFRVSDWIQMGQKTDLMKWASVLETSQILYKQARKDNRIQTNWYETEQYGTEQVWFISLLNKYLDSKIDLLNYNFVSLNTALMAILNNFCVMNTRSTLKAHNLNWQFQPEFLACYMTENEYLDAYNTVYGNKT